MAVFAVSYRPILLETFDPVFHRATGGRGALVHVGLLALTVLNLVAALQTMGVVLALGLFLLPAVSAYLWCDHFGWLLVLSVSMAVVCSAAGILLSYAAGLASGAAIVLSSARCFSHPHFSARATGRPPGPWSSSATETGRDPPT